MTVLPAILSIFGIHSKEDPTVPLTAEVILGTQKILDGINTTPETGAMYSSAVFCGERFLVEALASLPILTYNTATKDRADDDPAAVLLKVRPNQHQTPYILWSTAWRKAIRLGNAYIYVEEDQAGRPANLLLLENNRIKVKLINGQKVYSYTGDQDYTIPNSRMIHLMGYSEDGCVGIPLLQYAQRAIGLALLTEDYGLRYFTEGEQTSGGYVKVPFSDNNKIKAVKAAITAWKLNRHQIPIIPEGGEYVSTTTNNETAQYLKTREFQMLEIARFMRVPPHILMHYSTGGTYSNVESQGIDLVTNCLQSWITQGEQEINRVLYPDGQNYAEYLVDARLRGDTLSRMQAYQIGLQNRIFTRNECRRHENLPPVQGGDLFDTPTFLTPGSQGATNGQ